jgi:dienelactone hydrolase
MNETEECYTIPPFTSDYTPNGENVNLDGMNVYITGKDNSNTLIAVYDIFGYHNNTLQFCDVLSQAGFRVVVPDFFYGNPFNADNMDDRDKRREWNRNAGSWDKTRSTIVMVIDYLKQHYNVESFGIFGLCWGGKIAVYSSQDKSLGFKGAALIHPSRTEDDDAKTVKIPLLVMPSKNEPDLTNFVNNLPDGVKERSEHYRFDDMQHGFCGARGDMNDRNMVKRIYEANMHVQNFFKKVFNN